MVGQLRAPSVKTSCRSSWSSPTFSASAIPSARLAITVPNTMLWISFIRVAVPTSSAYHSKHGLHSRKTSYQYNQYHAVDICHNGTAYLQILDICVGVGVCWGGGGGDIQRLFIHCPQISKVVWFDFQQLLSSAEKTKQLTAKVEGFPAHGLKTGKAVIIELAVTRGEDGQLSFQGWHPTAAHWGLQEGAPSRHHRLHTVFIPPFPSTSKMGACVNCHAEPSPAELWQTGDTSVFVYLMQNNLLFWILQSRTWSTFPEIWNSANHMHPCILVYM